MYKSYRRSGLLQFFVHISSKIPNMSLAPPFTEEAAHAKVKKAQDLWNTQCVHPS